MVYNGNIRKAILPVACACLLQPCTPANTFNLIYYYCCCCYYCYTSFNDRALYCLYCSKLCPYSGFCAVLGSSIVESVLAGKKKCREQIQAKKPEKSNQHGANQSGQSPHTIKFKITSLHKSKSKQEHKGGILFIVTVLGS